MGDITDKLRETQLTEDAQKRAAADPLPGSLAEAFLSDAIQVGDNLYVRRVVASDWRIIKALDSPLYRQMLEYQKPEETREEIEFSDEEQWEMCWQFTHSPKECRALLAKGRDAFRETASEMADTISMPQMPMIIKAIVKQIYASFETSIKYSGDGDEKKTS